MLSYILNRSSKYACTFIAFSFASLFMLTSLLPVNAFESDHQKGQAKYMMDQKVACSIKNSSLLDDLSNDFVGNHHSFYMVEPPSSLTMPISLMKCVMKRDIPTNGTVVKVTCEKDYYHNKWYCS